jgi:ketosteroid isomerase-like protein
METEASRQLVLDYLKAQGNGDGDKIVEILDENVCWRPPAAAGLGVPTGRNAVLQAMNEAGQRFFDLTTMKSEIKWIVAEGDKVVVRQHNEAKASNGRDYSNEYVWVYICRDGKIVEIEEHTDSQRFSDIVLS